LKLKYPEGEVDFIVTAAISSLPPIERQIDLTEIRKGLKPTIWIDTPVEIALKKLHYRATMLKPRDVFDISVIDAIDGPALTAHLHEVARRRKAICCGASTASRRTSSKPNSRSSTSGRDGKCIKRPVWNPSAESSNEFRSPPRKRKIVRDPKPLCRIAPEGSGAGEGNRTLVFSLEGCCSTIELHPHWRWTNTAACAPQLR
jgi:hypothetical protein